MRKPQHLSDKRKPMDSRPVHAMLGHVHRLFMSSFHPFAANRLGQNISICFAVLLAHVAGLWGLQRLPSPTPPAQIVPVEVIATLITPEPDPVALPQPVALAVPKPAPQSKPLPTAKPPQKTNPKPMPKPRPPPLPKAVADPTPAPSTAPTGTLDPAPPTSAPTESAVAPNAPSNASASASTSTAAADSGPAVVMPSSNAGYLNNPRPAYPSISRRMGEEGKVMLRVYVNAQGLPEQIELQQSSGFERLDKAAMDAVRRWKFVPGTRNGVPEAMWNIVPINFVLE